MTTETEPVLSRPGLRAFVEAARAQPRVATRVTASDVQRGLAAQRRQIRHTRRVLGLGFSLGAAAGLVGAWLGLLLVSDPSQVSELAGPAPLGLSQAELQSPSSFALADAAALDPAVRIRSNADAEPPGISGPWAIALGEGVHEIAVTRVAHRALSIAIPDRALELVHGQMRVDIVGRTAVVRLESGIAAWIEPDGTRTAIEVERIALSSRPESSGSESRAPAAVEKPRPTAAELARAAENHLLAGDRAAAISTLRNLIRTYPRTAQTRTAVMDLAAQERLSGHRDRARCAYQLYRDRWPHSEVRAELDKQLATLGAGPACRGLDPTLDPRGDH